MSTSASFISVDPEPEDVEAADGHGAGERRLDAADELQGHRQLRWENAVLTRPADRGRAKYKSVH
jgi:hypothetical protein